MRKLSILLLASISAAAFLSGRAGSEPYAERLIRLEAADALPHMASTLKDEPVAVNAVFLAYSGDEALALNARLALIQYPEMTRRILPLYYTELEFQEVLARYGADVVPPIHYFLTHDSRMLELRRYAGELVQDATDATSRMWNQIRNLMWNGEDIAPADPVLTPAGDDEWRPLTPAESGRYAVKFIREEGHDFLGQFAVGADEQVVWVQTERAAEVATAFLASGLRTVETKSRLDQELEGEDYLWAGVDVLVVAGSVKVLRAGKAARAAKTGTATSRTARTASVSASALRVGRIGRGAAKWGAVAATGYVVLRHPELINSLSAEVASLLGLPAWVVQFTVWSVVLLPVLYVGLLLFKLVVKPLLFLLQCARRGVVWIERKRPRPRFGY